MKHSIDTQINSFLSGVLIKEQPHLVVTVERKGTALLRTLRGQHDLLDRSVRQVVASDALELLPPAALSGKRILLVDDAVYRGRRIRNTRDVLQNKKGVQPDCIKVAAFSIHKNVRPGIADYCWFGRLDDDGFRSTRQAMLRAFQAGGSLLLATERLQEVVTLRCSRVEFFEALSRAGTGVEQFSSAGRSNLTIHDPVIIDESELQEKLQAGSVEGSIRKLRVVERADGLFSICPIFYPTITVPSDVRLAVRTNPVAVALLGDYDESASDELIQKALFQISALVASAHLLRTVSAFLEPLQVADKIAIQTPEQGLQTSALSHLSMLFPLMASDAVATLLGSSMAYRQRWSRYIRGDRQPARIDAGVGTSGERKVNELHWQLVRDCFAAIEHDPARASGLTWREMVDSVLGEPQLVDTGAVALLSAALDRAIDDADVVTDVGVRFAANGDRQLVRVFRPDGEMVTSDLRRVCALWKGDGPPPSSDDM